MCSIIIRLFTTTSVVTKYLTLFPVKAVTSLKTAPLSVNQTFWRCDKKMSKSFFLICVHSVKSMLRSKIKVNQVKFCLCVRSCGGKGCQNVGGDLVVRRGRHLNVKGKSLIWDDFWSVRATKKMKRSYHAVLAEKLD